MRYPATVLSTESSPLKQFLTDKLRRGRRISFRDYMHWCLYHPEYGYYMQGRERTGKAGDFFTSTDVGPLFARIVARQIVEIWDMLGRPDPFDLVEMGAGRGLFALDFLQWAEEKAPVLERTLRYTLIESGEKQAGAALTLLRKAGPRERVRTVPNLDALGQVIGCFLSNELVDAFPVSVVGRIDGRLKELYLTLKDAEWEEEFGPLSSTEVAAYVARYAHELEEGCRVEVNLGAVEWMRAVAAKLERGFILTVDYGNLASQLYRTPLARGTLLAFRHHRASEDFYRAPGEQDLTAHVNFSALIDEGSALGLDLTGFTTQEKFLMALGESDQFAELFEDESSETEKLQARLRLKRLIHPEDMGEVFKVLIQHRGVGGPKLTGLKYASRAAG